MTSIRRCAKGSPIPRLWFAVLPQAAPQSRRHWSRVHERIDAIASAVAVDLQSDLDDAALTSSATAHIASLDDVLALPDMQPSVGGEGPVVLTWTRALRAALQRVIDATTAAAPGDIDREATALLVLADRSRSLADQMGFGFLYDRTRHLFSIGYRLADAEGPGVLDPSFYDLLASEARLASFIAIARGDVPQQHWFHLGRRAMSVEGVPTLLSWSATMFEYLMPSLLMRSFPARCSRRPTRAWSSARSSTDGSAKCPGASPNRLTTSATGTTRTSTAPLACLGSDSSVAWPTTW